MCLGVALLSGSGCGRTAGERPVPVPSGTVIGNAQGWYDGGVGLFGGHGGAIFELAGDRMLMAGGTFPELQPVPEVFAICGDGVVMVFSLAAGVWKSQAWHYQRTADGTMAVWLGSDEGEGPIGRMVKPVDRDVFESEWRKQYGPHSRHQASVSTGAKAR